MDTVSWLRVWRAHGTGPVDVAIVGETGETRAVSPVDGSGHGGFCTYRSHPAARTSSQDAGWSITSPSGSEKSSGLA